MFDIMLMVALLAAGMLIGVLIYKLQLRLTLGSVQSQAEKIHSDAEREKERMLHDTELNIKKAELDMQRRHEKKFKQQRDNLIGVEKRLRQRETNVERKSELLERRERDLKKREAGVEKIEAEARQELDKTKAKLDKASHELERVAGLSPEEAKQQLMELVAEEAHQKAEMHVRRIEEEARSKADMRAKEIVATTMQRLAGEFVAENTVSVVELPSDDMKGRIIGREGRNIRSIEAATGVDIIIDDTPEAVILSSFNPVRREIAKRSLERLIADGRIHPARIEEVVNKVAAEMDQTILRYGEQATFDLALHGVHLELIKLIGKLKFRNTEGQNVWNHSVETANIAGMMASELGLNVNLVKRAGLLHDIGKAVDHEMEGNHAHVGAEQARRFGEKKEVVSAIRHHHDAEPPSVFGVLVHAANRLSNARPGARRDQLETYVKRLEDLERISKSFAGIENAYVIQAGREVRVMVNYETVPDNRLLAVAEDIAQRIQDELTYPGEVRVTVIREARASDLAR